MTKYLVNPINISHHFHFSLQKTIVVREDEIVPAPSPVASVPNNVSDEIAYINAQLAKPEEAPAIIPDLMLRVQKLNVLFAQPPPSAEATPSKKRKTTETNAAEKEKNDDPVAYYEKHLNKQFTELGNKIKGLRHLVENLSRTVNFNYSKIDCLKHQISEMNKDIVFHEVQIHDLGLKLRYGTGC